MSDPKIYCDTSLIIDYLIASGREPEVQYRYDHIPETKYSKSEGEFWNRLLKKDKRFKLATKLRSIVGWQFPNVKMVVSPFVLIELDGWCAEESFKRYAVECTNVKIVQTFSRKQIGAYIQEIMDEADDSPDDSYVKNLWYSIAGSTREEALDGIIIEKVDGLEFDSDTFKKVGIFACLQMGMADIVHLLSADQLQCDYFATTDSDFNRVKKQIEKEFSFKILFKDEILKIVKPG